jgi:eukaryotic-like serine/threonine-protein kinase
MPDPGDSNGPGKGGDTDGAAAGDGNGDGGRDAVAARIAAGDHAGAARLAAERGELGRAIALYERIWRFADAVPLALALGDRPLAIRLALDAGDPEQATAITEAIPREAEAELRAAARALAGRGRHWDAGRLAERAGAPAEAATYYRRAGSLVDTGRMEEAAGRLHQAGLVYEQALALAAGDDEAGAARLALGRLLGRLGRHEDAARSLQQAARLPSCRAPAWRALCVQLLALGYRVAAAEIAARLHRELPELPATPEEIAALEQADLAAGASAVGQLGAEPGLLRRRFKVLRSLGAGATGAVYLAEDTLLGQQVALKLLSVGAGGRGAERQAYLRLAREAEAAGRLRHPNIVGLYDADPAMGLFVLELMSGGTLADRLAAEGPLPPALARRMALDLLAALVAAHRRGITHRDVKPANAFFDAAGNAKLGDFGAAHLVDFGQTQTGGLVGTVAYMSPEQITGAPIGPAADLYALGITLFEALTGRLPFPGPDVVSQHLGDEPPVPSALRPELSEAHDRVLARALRKAPGERWASAEEMAAAIAAWPVSARAAGAGAAAEAPRAIAADDDDPAAPGAPVDSPAEVLVGPTADGLLYRREEPRLGRPVLVERRAAPVEGEALAILQKLASAAGPRLQRVLALSDDGHTVTYELVEGPVVPVASLPAPTRADCLSPHTPAGNPPPPLPTRALLTVHRPTRLIV